MSKACFDSNGFLVWLLRGQVPTGAAQSGQTVITVPDATQANDIFYNGTQVVPRQDIVVNLDTTIIGSDGVDAANLSGIPANGWIAVNGVAEQVTGGARQFKASTPMSLRVELIGLYRAPVMTIQAIAPANIESSLIQQINAQRESYQMTMLTSGTAKQSAYATKQAEIEAWYQLGATVTQITTAFGLLTTATKARRYRYLMAEMAITGDAAATVIARFQAGADTAAAKVARYEAIAQKGIMAIRAASTLSGKRAAAAAVDWNA